MAVSLNSVVGFSSTLKLQAKYQYVPRTSVGSSVLKDTHFTFTSKRVGLRKPMKDKKWGPYILAANGDVIATETSDKGSGNAEISSSDDKSSTVNPPSPSEVSNGSIVSSDLKEDTTSGDIKTSPKRSRLTARVRAARALSRYTESKPSKKPELGSKVLEVLRESDRGKNKKRSGLPEAPTNLFDDSKRGMPKKGLTFEFPGGADVFLIVFSVIFISTVMFTTTYIVWKVGAIHFNEY